MRYFPPAKQELKSRKNSERFILIFFSNMKMMENVTPVRAQADAHLFFFSSFGSCLSGIAKWDKSVQTSILILYVTYLSL